MAANKGGGGPRRLVQFSVEQGEDGVRVDVTIPPPPTPPDAVDLMPLNPSWRWLSPLGLRIVRLLCGAGWLSREEVAGKLSENPEGDIRPLLTDLVKRGVLESSGRKGYHVAIPESADPEAYRRALLVWLDGQEADMPDRPT